MPTTPGIRRLADQTPEQLRKMGLICQAARERNLTEWLFRCQHEFLRQFQPQAKNVHVRSSPEALFEGAGEITDAKRDLLSHRIEAHRAVQVLPQIPIYLALLPRRQATTGARRFNRGRRPKECHEPRNRRARGVRISLHRPADIIEKVLGGKSLGRAALRAPVLIPTDEAGSLNWRYAVRRASRRRQASTADSPARKA